MLTYSMGPIRDWTSDGDMLRVEAPFSIFDESGEMMHGVRVLRVPGATTLPAAEIPPALEQAADLHVQAFVAALQAVLEAS